MVACAVVVAGALVAAGCGATTRPNDPRPAVSTRISVILTPKAVIVQPGEVAMGEEPTQQIPQNRGAKQPPINSKKPLDITFVAANQTGDPAHLIVKGPAEAKSGPVFARSPATFQASLPTGSYTVTAADVPGARPAHFDVGPYRAGSENELLLP